MTGTTDPKSPAWGTQPRLIGVLDAAASLSITKRELYRRIAAGEIESVRIGRRRLIPADALDAYVARLRREAAA